jgi:hypothetical protein
MPDPIDHAVEEAVRRYLARVVMRYVPFGLAIVIFLAMVIAVPTLSPSGSGTQATGGVAGNGVSTGAGGGSTGGSTGGGATSAGGVGGSGGVSLPGGVAPPGGGSVAFGLSGGGTGTGTGAASGPGASAGGTASTVAPPGASGTTITGGRCAAGVRQVSWSAYSTLCAPVFTGDNGGATSFGVTGSTITATFRISDSGEAGAVAAASPSLNQAAQNQYEEDLDTYVDYFNSQFELYGRHVVMKEFTGQGDWVQEYQGQDPQGAEADAATARHLGAFADLSSAAVSTTPLYAQYLATDHIVSAGGVAGSDHYYETYAPYIFTAGASTSNLVDWMPNVVCQRMKGLPAIFGGDPGDATKTRKFGLIYPTNPDFQLVGNQVKSALEACGTPIADTYEYAINLSTMASDSTIAMAQMRADGVTTVVCLCDTLVPRFLTIAAAAQNYHPEWVFTGEADTLGQTYEQSEWAHAIAPDGTTSPDDQTEAFKVYLMASHGRRPVSLYYEAAYSTAILFFDALQNAGPDLTPATFQQGFFGLPPSLPGGQLGPWSFGVDHWTATAAAQIGWWSPSTTSNANNTAGAWLACSGADGDFHPWEPRSGYGPAGTQLHCFGK